MIDYLDALVQTNDIKCLPKDVQEKYNIQDCYVYVDDIWDFYEKLKEEIVETITEINSKVIEYKDLIEIDAEAAEKLFWDDEESLKAQAYYYNNLSGYNIPTLKPYKQYLDKITAEKNGNIFGNKNKDEYEEDDLSWLEELI